MAGSWADAILEMLLDGCGPSDSSLLQSSEDLPYFCSFRLVGLAYKI